MLRKRCVPLFGVITEDLARRCIAQMLFLAHESPRLPATVLIDSPGGSAAASLAIIETMGDFPFEIGCHCCGLAGGTAAVIIGQGRGGLRTAKSDARFSFASTIADAAQGYLETELSQIDEKLIELVAETTSKHRQEIAELFSSGIQLDAPDALRLGLIDQIAELPRALSHR
jgi:ATP-dependent Clp protease protease subunit